MQSGIHRGHYTRVGDDAAGTIHTSETLLAYIMNENHEDRVLTGCNEFLRAQCVP